MTTRTASSAALPDRDDRAAVSGERQRDWTNHTRSLFTASLRPQMRMTIKTKLAGAFGLVLGSGLN